MSTRTEIDWLTEASMFFEKRGPVWETLQDLESRLNDSGIPYVIIDGLALNAQELKRVRFWCWRVGVVEPSHS